MDFKKTIGIVAASAVLMAASANVFAAPVLENFNPVVQHEIITDDENSEHALRATARVEIPEGVTVNSDDFMWVINAEEDIFNPINGVYDDDTKDEVEKISDETEADVMSNDDKITFDTDEDEVEKIGDEAAEADYADIDLELGEIEGERRTAKLRANAGTVITGSSNVVFGLVLILDIPLNEDKFDIDFQLADSDAAISSIQ